MPFGTEVDLGPGDIVLDGDSAPPLLKGTALTQFSAHVRCGQTDGWTKMPFGVKVGLGPGHFVLDGDPTPPKRPQPPPNFRRMSIVAKRLDGSICHLVRR